MREVGCKLLERKFGASFRILEESHNALSVNFFFEVRMIFITCDFTKKGRSIVYGLG
jgi:hypothetical protein